MKERLLFMTLQGSPCFLQFHLPPRTPGWSTWAEWRWMPTYAVGYVVRKELWAWETWNFYNGRETCFPLLWRKVLFCLPKAVHCTNILREMVCRKSGVASCPHACCNETGSVGTTAPQVAQNISVNEGDGIHTGCCWITFQLAEHFWPAAFNDKLRGTLIFTSLSHLLQTLHLHPNL